MTDSAHLRKTDAISKNFYRKKDSVRIKLDLSLDKMATVMRLRTVLNPFIGNPEAVEHTLVNYGHAELGVRDGIIVLYTNTKNLDETLAAVRNMIEANEVPLVKANKPTVVVEFKNFDDTGVQQFLERNKSEKLLKSAGRIKSDYGKAFTFAH